MEVFKSILVEDLFQNKIVDEILCASIESGKIGILSWGILHPSVGVDVNRGAFALYGVDTP
jgi:hypothetical protein